MWSSASSFFHLAYFLGSTMWQYKSALHSFFWLNTIPLYGYTTFCLSMQLIDIWVVSTFWLLWIMWLWTFMCKLLCGHMFSVLLDIYPWVKLLLCGNSVLSFEKLSYCFSKQLHVLHFHQQCMRVLISLHLANTCFSLVFFLLWLFWVPWNSICILEMACQFLQRSQLRLIEIHFYL